MRRVGSIALVHELLSTAPDETVPFDEVADRVLSMVAELSSQGRRGPGAGRSGRGRPPVRTGSFGDRAGGGGHPAGRGAVRAGAERGRARPGRADPGLLEVRAGGSRACCGSRWWTTGSGCRRASTWRASDRLGLQIVRTLVEGELGGTLRLDRREGGGTRAAVDVPLAA